MADLQSTDVLLVNRAGVDYRVTKANVMATVQDTDLLLVNRAGVDYKATYADVKKGFGPQHINPAPSDWTFNPAIVSGTGTQADPFVITPATVNAPGGTAQSAQTLSLTGLTPNDLVEWTDHSVGAGNRFHQLLALVPSSGKVDLRLSYADTPASTASQTYTGNLQIGTTHFRWAVTQVATVAPDVNTVTLSDVAGGGRFTSTAFPVSATMVEDGVPKSDKKLKAYVEGALKSAAVTSGIASVSATDYSPYLTGSAAVQDAALAFDTDVATRAQVSHPGGAATSWIAFQPPSPIPVKNLRIYTYQPQGTSGANTYLSVNDGADITPWSAAPNSSDWSNVVPVPGGVLTRVQVKLTYPGGVSGVSIYAIELDGVILNSSDTTLTFANPSTLTAFAGGDAITEVASSGSAGDAAGVIALVSSVDNKMIVKTSAGTWDVGSQVKGPLKTQTVTVTPTSDVITAVGGTAAAPVLTFATDKDLAKFAAGDAVRQNDAPAYARFLTSSPAFASATPASLAFDGLTTTSATTDASPPGATRSITFAPQPPIPATSLRIYSYAPTYGSWNSKIRVNGGALTTYVSAPGNAAGWYDATPLLTGGALTSFVIEQADLGGSTALYLHAIEVNGVILVSGTNGTVASTDPTAKTMTLATSSGTWGPANTGKFVIGPTKTTPVSNVKLYCKLNAAGAVSDLQSADPGFTPWTPTGTGPYTGNITWPATLPSGQPPDTDLPAGTTLTVEVQASNTAGTDTQKSNVLTPA